MDVVFCSHVLEHLALEDFYTALNNTKKILKRGGVFRVIVSSLKGLIDDYILQYDSEDQLVSSKVSIQFFKNNTVGKVKRSLAIKGILAECLGNSAHLWMWDKKSLSAALADAGFVDIIPFNIGDIR